MSLRATVQPALMQTQNPFNTGPFDILLLHPWTDIHVHIQL